MCYSTRDDNPQASAATASETPKAIPTLTARCLSTRVLVQNPSPPSFEDGKLSLEELVAGGLLLQGPARAFDVAVVAANLQTSLNAIMEQLDGRINPLGPECRAQAM